MPALSTPQQTPMTETPGLSIGGEVPVADIIRQVNDWGNQYMQSLAVEAEDAGLGEPMSLGAADNLVDTVADDDNTDGHQVLVADTGSDMDAWVGVTGQEQATDGSLGSLVDSAIANANGEPIESVEFKSHGAANWQEVGSAPSGELRSPLTEEQKAEFARLGAAMAPDGVILLAGCQVAANFEEGASGLSLMIEVAQAANRAVRAGVAIQLPIDGIEGTSVTAYPDGSYVVDTSLGKQIYDVSADGLMRLKNDVMGADSVGEAVGDVAETAGEMATDYYAAFEEWWNS